MSKIFIADELPTGDSYAHFENEDLKLLTFEYIVTVELPTCECLNVCEIHTVNVICGVEPCHKYISCYLHTPSQTTQITLHANQKNKFGNDLKCTL